MSLNGALPLSRFLSPTVYSSEKLLHRFVQSCRFIALEEKTVKSYHF
jgi:hypothetical protein